MSTTTGTPRTTVTAATVVAAVAALREKVSGPVLAPGDDGFERACAAWNTAVEHRPFAVVVPQSEDDVVAALGVAHRHALPVAVQATGRGVCTPADGALLVSTAGLRGVEVDPQARTVRVAAGVPWGEVLAATTEHGLVPALGSSPGVGVLGYTLGGGLGWFARAWGTGADGALAFDVVLPDGTRTTADATSGPELFRALRGAGGGGFGVVLGVTLELHPLAEVYAGNLWYPAEQAVEVGRRWREWSDGAPDELTTALALMTYPDAERVPEPLRGKAFVIVRGAWCGDVADGAALVDLWRDWAEPVLDEWRARPLMEVGEVSQDPMDPLPMVGTTELLEDLTDEALEAFVDGWGYGPNGELRVMFGEVRRLGGAIAAKGTDAVDDRLRAAGFALWYATVARNDAQRRRVAAHLAGVRERLAPHVTGGVFLNFAAVGEKAGRTAQAFGPANLERLQALKARLDPDDRFRFGLALGAPAAPAGTVAHRLPMPSPAADDEPAPGASDASGAPRPSVTGGDGGSAGRSVPVADPVQSGRSFVAPGGPPRPPAPRDGLPDGYASPGFVVPPVVTHPALAGEDPEG